MPRCGELTSCSLVTDVTRVGLGGYMPTCPVQMVVTWGLSAALIWYPWGDLYLPTYDPMGPSLIQAIGTGIPSTGAHLGAGLLRLACNMM